MELLLREVEFPDAEGKCILISTTQREDSRLTAKPADIES
jgi:hypothetical protein